MIVHQLPARFLEHSVMVVLAGCGGNGSQMLGGLARLDRALRSLGHPGGLDVAVFDPDDVAEPNVGRQLFSPADIGQNKAAVLVHRVNQFFGLRWQACPQKFEGQSTWHTGPFGGTADLLITCVDSARARREIHTAITQHDRGSAWRPAYWLDLGNRQRDGQVILGQPVDRINGSRSIPDRLPTVVDVFPELLDAKFVEDDRPSCSLAEALESQDLFINQHVASWALHLLWSLFRTGKTEVHGYFVNLATGQANPMPVPAQEVKPASLAVFACKRGRRR